MFRNVPTALRRLQPRHRKLLQLIYDPFRATGKWPSARSILLAMRHDGDLGDLCRELGPEFLFCNLGDDPGATCELRVRALAQVHGAEQERGTVLAAILYLLKLYIDEAETRALVEVSGQELETVLRITETEARRLAVWLQYAPMVLGRFTQDLPQSRAQLTVSREIVRLEGVRTFDEYLARSEAIERERRKKADAQSGTVGRVFGGWRPGVEGEPSAARAQPTFIDQKRLADLRAIKGKAFDLRRVIKICEELNACYQSECFLAVAMLTRALLDHVPPIFKVATFEQVASNYGGPKSFRDHMGHLQHSARKIADTHLHVPIRAKETLPTRTQVNFAADIDVLLGEIVRTLRS